jgi:hypothetical protein
VNAYSPAIVPATVQWRAVNVIGISAFYHEPAWCLAQDGRLVNPIRVEDA